MVCYNHICMNILKCLNLDLVLNSYIVFNIYLNCCPHLSPHSPTKSDFIRAKYQMLAFVHKLPCRDDDGVTTKDLSKVRLPKDIRLLFLSLSLYLSLTFSSFSLSHSISSIRVLYTPTSRQCLCRWALKATPR